MTLRPTNEGQLYYLEANVLLQKTACLSQSDNYNMTMIDENKIYLNMVLSS